MRRLGAQRGQTTAEYLGLLVLVALIVTAIGASGLKDTVVAGMQAAICEMFPDENCAVSDEELARGDPDTGAPRAPVPDPDLPTIQRTATTRDLGLSQPAGIDGAPGAAPTRQASLELPIPLPPGGQTLLPPTDDPTVREFSGIENLERGFRALGEGDLPRSSQGPALRLAHRPRPTGQTRRTRRRARSPGRRANQTGHPQRLGAPQRRTRRSPHTRRGARHPGKHRTSHNASRRPCAPCSAVPGREDAGGASGR